MLHAKRDADATLGIMGKKSYPEMIENAKDLFLSKGCKLKKK